MYVLFSNMQNLEEQINALLGDQNIPQYARTLIDLLARQLSDREREHRALRRALRTHRYEHLISTGTTIMEEDSGWTPDILTLTSICIFVFIVFYALRQWIKGAQFTEKVSARGKVAIVTGANSGIGKQLVRELNLRYAKVYMACRSVSRGQEAVCELLSRYGCDITRMVVRECDLNDFSSVRKFVEGFNREEDKLDILVNNAGIILYPRFEKTVDGHETIWQSNYLGHFLLTELLLPKLEQSEDGGRIVNLSSKMHQYADGVQAEVVNSPRHFTRFKLTTYARSKLANAMHAKALTKRIRDKNAASKVTINACCPGPVNTNVIRVPFYTKYVKKVLAPIIWFVLKTEQDGAQTPLFLALSKKIAGISGKYYSDCKEAKTHKLVEDDLACEILYNDSLEQCGLDHSSVQ